MGAYHLAQLNIGRLLAPLDSPQLEGFVTALEPINALADAAPGFVWRLQTDEGDATGLRPFDDDMMIVNMTVWASLEALREYVYRTDHRAVMAQRRQWFERMAEAFLVLWWVPAGHIPTVEEAKERLLLLREQGPTAEAFTFRQPFPPPDVVSSSPPSGWSELGSGSAPGSAPASASAGSPDVAVETWRQRNAEPVGCTPEAPSS